MLKYILLKGQMAYLRLIQLYYIILLIMRFIMHRVSRSSHIFENFAHQTHVLMDVKNICIRNFLLKQYILKVDKYIT